MNKNNQNSTSRETLLMVLLNKVTKEYKAFIEFTLRRKPLKIIEILELSSIPGATKFTIQLINKNFILKLSAAEIIKNGYDLNDFDDFHADMICYAAQGKLIEFLKLSDKNHLYKIIERRFDKALQQHVYIIEDQEQIRYARTVVDLSNDRNFLRNMDISDIYDIGFTHGCESILKEETALLLAKEKHKYSNNK